MSFLSEAWHQILERPSGPLAFRFYFQPLMAALLAVRDGIADAHAGRSPYLWSLFTMKEGRGERIRSGWHSIVKVFAFAFFLDVIYQIAVLHALRPIEGLIIASVLAIVPYILVRGPARRIARRIEASRRHHRSAKA
jgi:hypothetical protein